MADLILHNGTIYSLASGLEPVQAISVRGGRIAYAGDDQGALDSRKDGDTVIDLRGRTVLPGMCDAHCHMRSLGQREELVDLRDARSYAELIERVRERASRTPDGEWVVGRGGNGEVWDENTRPVHGDLSAAVPDHPVWLTRVDGHAGFGNAHAMELAGVSPSTQSPPGGLILKESGKPTGVFLDAAMNMVRERIPEPDVEQIKRYLLRAQDLCLAAGLTEVHDAGISETDLLAYRALVAEGRLKIRVYAMLRRDYFLRYDALPLEEGSLTVRAVKVVLDGALGSRGAALHAPYTDEPDLSGLLLVTDEEFAEIVRKALRIGFQMCVHTIGDRANTVALDALPESVAPAGDYRSRLEHAQIMTLRDIGRLKDLGVIASVQPTHATSDMNMAEARLGPERIEGAYAWRRTVDAGGRMAGGSDFPVEGHNPLWGVYAAVTRQDHAGSPPGGWRPKERLTMEESLRLFTVDTAYAAFRESDRGTLTEGMWADFVVLDRDIVTGSPKDLLDAKVTATVVGGQTVSGDLQASNIADRG